MNILEILKQKLIGNFYSVYSIGDIFSLAFNNFWIVAQNIKSPDEAALNHSIINTYKPANEAVDKEDIVKSIIICSTLRKKIIEVSITKTSELELTFENKVTLLFPTDTDTVDWQWAINNYGRDPYSDFIIGCYWSGEIEISSI